jgi:hypothetical protein
MKRRFVMGCDVLAAARLLITTLTDFIDKADLICDDYCQGLRLEGFLEAVDRYLREILVRQDLAYLSDDLEQAMTGCDVTQEEHEERDQQALCRDLLKLATEDDDPNAIAYLREHFGIDLKLLAEGKATNKQ